MLYYTFLYVVKSLIQSKEDGKCKIVEYTFTSHSFSFIKKGITEEKLNNLKMLLIPTIDSIDPICATYIRDFIDVYSLPPCQEMFFGYYNVHYMCKDTCENVFRDSCLEYIQKSRLSSQLFVQLIQCNSLPDNTCNQRKPRKG